MKPNSSASASKFTRYAAASAAAIGAATVADAQFTGAYSLEGPPAGTFNSPADPSTFGLWTFDMVAAPSGAAATLITSSGPSLSLSAYSGYTSGTASFSFYTTAAATGTVSFDFSSVLTGSGGADGSFRTMVNFVDNHGFNGTSSGPVTFAVNSGDTFGFRVLAAYVPYATMQVAITNFSAPAAIPEAGTSSLLAGVASLGFVGLLARRKLQARAAAQA
jgi:hypothetical protein